MISLPSISVWLVSDLLCNAALKHCRSTESFGAAAATQLLTNFAARRGRAVDEDRPSEGRSTTVLDDVFRGTSQRVSTDELLYASDLFRALPILNHLVLRLHVVLDGVTGRSMFAAVDDKDDDQQSAEKLLCALNVERRKHLARRE